MKKLLLPILFVVFYSCNKHSNNNEETLSTEIDTLKTEKTISKSLLENTEEDTITNVKFKELSISINRFIVYDEGNKLNEIQKDTVNLYAELGETIEGQKITILSNQIANITIEQRYETSILIGDEGEHFDLTDWKHYYSNWKTLKSNDLGEFIYDKYSLEDSEKFPKIKIEELKTKFKTICPECDSLISKIKNNIEESPVEIVISRYFIRIKGKRKDNDESITKIIIIEVPMSC